MISFSNPSWLYGLSGLLIPIGIHLLSRKEGKTIYIGSIRHLTDSDTAQFSSIRLNEILLLILRMILIVLLVFILAGFSFQSDNDKTQKWLLIEKGIEKNKNYTPVVDSLKKNGFEVHWLAEGFPKLEDSTSIGRSGNYFRLIRRIPSSIDTALVISYAYDTKFKGETIALPKNIKWLSVESENSEVAIDAIRIGSDSVATRITETNATGTASRHSLVSAKKFSDIDKLDSLKIRNRDTVFISIYATPKFTYDRKIIQAALQAIAERTPHVIEVRIAKDATTIAGDTDFIFWLSDEKPPLKNVVVIGYASCENKNLPLATTQQKVSQFCDAPEFDWILTQRLNEENVLRESFSFSLSQIVLPGFNNDRASLSDHRTLPTTAVFAESKPEQQINSIDQEVKAGSESFLAILLFILLITERFIAFKRNQ